MNEIPGHQPEVESLTRRETVRVPDIFVKQFIQFFDERTRPFGFTLSRLDFEGGHPKDPAIVAINEIGEPHNLDIPRNYLLEHHNGILAYFITLQALFLNSGTSYCARITQVPSLQSFQGLRSHWVDFVFPGLPEPRYRGKPDQEYLPSLVIQSDVFDQWTVELIGEDFNLEDFYEFLTVGAIPKPTT